MSARLRLIGAKEMQANLLKLSRDFKKSLERNIKKFAEEEMREMKRRTPVDTGTLRSSGFVENPKWVEAHTLRVELGFGGPAESYAIYVHEDLEAFHRVGEAKFVERPLNESAPYFLERVMRGVAKDLGL